MVVGDVGRDAPVTSVPGQATPVDPGFLSVLDPGAAAIVPLDRSQVSTGRRLALARWITLKENPLTAA